MELEESARVDAVDLSSLEPGFSVDPFPTYDRLRASAPAVRVVNHGLPGWLVTRHEDVERLLTDSRLSNDPRVANPAPRSADACGAASPAMWFSTGQSN
jgi:cytochrome P450